MISDKTQYYFDVNFNMSANKCHTFMIALTAAKGVLLSYTVLSNGHSEYKRSKHEFVSRILIDSVANINIFKELYDGDFNIAESASGSGD